MYSLVLSLLATVGSIVCGLPPSRPAAPEYLSGARLDVQHKVDAGLVQIVALYDAPAGVPDSLRYELEMLRTGRAGRSSSRQGGKIMPRPGRTDTLAASRVNVSAGDRLQIHLRLYAGQAKVAEAHHDAVVSTVD